MVLRVTYVRSVMKQLPIS